METERTAADAFRLLSDETRLDVLRAVARAQRDERRTGVAVLSFSELYERVDVDNTSKLSYHLGELAGTFLRKVDGGYAFTHAGERIVRFVLAGNHRSPPDIGRIGVDGCCLHCGATALEATLRDQFFVIRCSECDRLVFSYRVTPAQVRPREPAELIRSVAREQAGDFRKMRGGVCPDCAGRLDTEVLDVRDEPVSDSVPVSFATSSECGQCLRQLSVPLTHAAVYHPESVAFHWDRGVDVLGTGVWEFHRHLREGRWSAERVHADPPEYRAELRHDTASIRLFLDETARVTRTERVRRSDQRDRVN